MVIITIFPFNGIRQCVMVQNIQIVPDCNRQVQLQKKVLFPHFILSINDPIFASVQTRGDGDW